MINNAWDIFLIRVLLFSPHWVPGNWQRYNTEVVLHERTMRSHHLPRGKSEPVLLAKSRVDRYGPGTTSARRF